MFGVMKGGELTASQREVATACDVKDETTVALQTTCEADFSEAGRKATISEQELEHPDRTAFQSASFIVNVEKLFNMKNSAGFLKP